LTAPAGTEQRNTAGTRLGWKIDTRAHGGYVVAPGSALSAPAGGRYRLLDASKPLAVPPWLLQRLSPPPLPPQRPVAVAVPGDRRSTYLGAALAQEADRVLTAQSKGQSRNHALYLAAVALGQLVAGGAITAERVEGGLQQAGVAAGLEPGEILPTIRSGLRAGANRPRQVSA
jgi:hypothetical protein